MRILICTGDGGGNVPPTVAIAGELIRRGHTVRLLAGPYFPGTPPSPNMEAAFAAVGCEVVSPAADAWAKDAGGMPDLTAFPEEIMMVRTMAMWVPVTVPWAVQTLQKIEEFQPDVVVMDLITPGAGIAAEGAGVPRVLLLTTVPVHRVLAGVPVPGRGAQPGEDNEQQRDEVTRRSSEVAMPYVNAARQAVGLGADDGPWQWEDRATKVVVLSSKAFDFPATEYPANMVYAGSVRPSEQRDGWQSPWDESDDRPLVVVSGTTTGLSGLWFAVFQASANAIIELGFRGLFTIGPLGAQMFPQNEALSYHSFVPHSAVLPKAAAMVTQCGHGATIAALRHGLPMVGVPVFADQPDIAGRIVHHGAGLRLSTLSSPTEFRDAIAAVVNEPRYREAAQKLAAQLANEDGIAAATDEIESAGRA